MNAHDWSARARGGLKLTMQDVNRLIADLAAAEERAEKAEAELACLRPLAIGGDGTTHWYYKDEWQAQKDRAEKAEASQTEFLKRCAALTIERDRLREEVESRGIPDGMRACPECEGRGYVEDWDAPTGRQQHGAD